MSELTAQIEHQEGVARIQLAGYVSSDNAPVLDDAFVKIGDAQKILLVFRQGDMITSAGIAVLFDLCLGAQDQGRQVRIVCPAAHFRKVFRLVGLSKAVEAFETEEEAAAA